MYLPHTIKRNPLDCVRLSLVADLSRRQSKGLSSMGFDLFNWFWCRDLGEGPRGHAGLGSRKEIAEGKKPAGQANPPPPQAQGLNPLLVRFSISIAERALN